jgi:hypothetical protein
MRMRLRPLLALCVLSGCATTTMHTVDRARDFDSRTIHKALVVSLTPDTGLRRLVEDEFVKQWRDRGVDAAASYKILPRELALERAKVGPFAVEHGYDTVLVTRLIGAQRIDPGIRADPFDVNTSTEPTLSEYTEAVVASPEYAGTYDVAVVAAHVYRGISQHQVWAGTIQTVVARDVPDVIGPYVKVILKNIYKSH